jgi:Fe-S cluster assembly protein SufD
MQPLRSYDEPELWDGTHTITVDNKEVEFKKVQDCVTDQGVHTTYLLKVPKNYAGAIVIKRHNTGNCLITIWMRLGESSRVTIIEEFTGSGCLKTYLELDAAWTDCEYHLLQNMDEDAVFTSEYEAGSSLGSLSWHVFCLGADTTMAKIKTLAGEKSDVKAVAAILGSGKQQFDIHCSVKHTGKNSKSNILTRSVLDGNSRGIYHGLISIETEADNVDSYQKDEAILLSGTAVADAIPNLEIKNNNVRCTHGATIGKLDEEKLFYLNTRGINDKDAKRIITRGFLEPLTLPAWQHLIIERISRS